MDDDSLSNTICRRLVNFILRTLRRPSSLPCSTRQVTVEEGSSRNPINSPNGFIGSEIAVAFNHINGSQGNEHLVPVLDPLKDGLIVSDQSKVQNVLDRNDGLQEKEALARKKGLKKTVTIMESEKKKNKEGDQSASNQATMVNNQPHGETKPSSPRQQHWPLLRVDTNINEKSDAYIERKKKDMGSLDPDQKS